MADYKILIAEDDDINLKYFLRIFRNHIEYEIFNVKNGVEAVNFVKENLDVSLILMDVKMPIMDGYEATKIIKSFKPDLPIIAVTAFAMLGDKEKSLLNGCDGYISKPFDAERLIAVIKKYLN